MNDRKLMVMFDLENTLIDSWNSGTALPSKWEIIKNHLDTHFLVYPYPAALIDFGIFSFAINNRHEVPKAIKMAEDVTQYKINPEFCPYWKQLEGLIFVKPDIQKWELVNLYGKHHMFNFYTAQFSQHDFLLFDDALPDDFNHMIRRNKANFQTITKIRV